MARPAAVQHSGETELLCDMNRAQHVTVGPGAHDFESVVEGVEHAAAFQGLLDCVDDELRHFREVEDGFVSDAFSFPPGLSQEDLRSAFSVGDGIDSQGHGCACKHSSSSEKACFVKNSR